MTRKISTVKKYFERRIYTIAFFSTAFCLYANAQTQNNAGALNTDSLYKVNQMKMQQDSLDAAMKKDAATATKKRDTRPISQRIDFNINTSFWINPTNTFFEFSPVVAYRFPKVISVGTGPTYIYNRDRFHKIDLSGWGGKVFSRAQLTKWFYAYTEYQGINNQYISAIDPNTHKISKSKEYVDSWFLSLGVNLRMGKRHGINMQALYDLLYNKENSPYYGALIYRIGFGF